MPITNPAKTFAGLVPCLCLLIDLPGAVGTEKPLRAVPVIVSAIAQTNAYRVGSPLLIDVEVFNGFDSEIGFPSLSLTPNEDNTETLSVDLVDIYRNGREQTIFRKRPDISDRSGTAVRIAGIGRERVAPKARKVIRIDLGKWQVVDGWQPGRYRFNVRVNNIDVDEFTHMRVLSKFVEITIK